MQGFPPGAPAPQQFPANPFAPSAQQPGASPFPTQQPVAPQYAVPPQPGVPGGYGVTPPAQYAGHTGATPMQAPPAQGQQWTPPTQFGTPPAQTYPAQQFGGGAAPGQPAQYGGGGGAPPGLPNLNDPKVANFTQHTPFIPRLPNEYCFQLLDVRYAGQGSKYFADFACLATLNKDVVGQDRKTGAPVYPAQPGREYTYQFDLARMCRSKDGSRTWQDQRPHQEIAMLMRAVRGGADGDNNAKLTELVGLPRDHIATLGIRVKAVVAPDGDGFTRTFFEPFKG